MFNPTPRLQKMLRRLPLSPKQAGKEYYKGNRVGSLGKIDQYGNFAPDWSKIRTFVYPVAGIENADLTPFVAANITPTRSTRAQRTEIYPKHFTGDEYLRAWKVAGGHDVVELPEGANGTMTTMTTRTNMPEPGEEKVASAGGETKPFEEKSGAKA